MVEAEAKSIDVVLVVKGAGTHKPDDTLNTFLKGFIPAVKTIGSDVKIRQEKLPEDFPVSPHTKEQHDHLTEISMAYAPQEEIDKDEIQKKKNTKTIWVKEIYWENELVPTSPWKAFFIEWQMASFALRRLLTLSYFWVKDFLKLDLQKHWKRNWFFAYLLSFTALYFIFGNFFLQSFRVVYGNSLLGQGSLWKIFAPDTQDMERLFTFIISLGIAFAPSIMANESWSQDVGHRKLSGLPLWLMVLLSLSFFFFTGQYLLLTLVIIIPVLLTNLIRGLLWKRRPSINSDYLKKEIPIPLSDGKYLSVYVPIIKIFYRFLIVFVLPILFLVLLVAKFLKFTKVLGAIGDSIEKFINIALGGILGDVSSYAMDQAQAYRVRSVVESEINYFTNRADVDHIHIFAHSQGTAITFETLFTQLRKNDRKKIKSYITIGSILSYYHANAPILEYSYPPTRFRLDTYPAFADDFQWVNCWNLLDPITDFQGLDEFDYDNVWGPDNVKTRARFHSDYWENVREVHVPFVKRILGLHDIESFWEKRKERNESWKSEKTYGRIVLSVFWMTVFYSIYLFNTYMKSFTFSLVVYGRRVIEIIEKSLAESGTDITFWTNLKTTKTYALLLDSWEYLSSNKSDILLVIVVIYFLWQIGVGVLEIVKAKKN